MTFHPRGLQLGSVTTRFVGVGPKTYDPVARTAHCIISVGSPVQRFYGTEKLRIASDAVILERMKSSGVPLLDSHNSSGIENALGRVSHAWIESNRGMPALMGVITFNDTERGRLAEGMVARGEIAGISAGYAVREWQITDADGKVIDPNTMRINYDDGLTFEARKWELLEASLVTVPADADAMVRSNKIGEPSAMFARSRMLVRQRIADSQVVADVRARMLARQRMRDRMRI